MLKHVGCTTRCRFVCLTDDGCVGHAMGTGGTTNAMDTGRTTKRETGRACRLTGMMCARDGVTVDVSTPFFFWTAKTRR